MPGFYLPCPHALEVGQELGHILGAWCSFTIATSHSAQRSPWLFSLGHAVLFTPCGAVRGRDTDLGSPRHHPRPHPSAGAGSPLIVLSRGSRNLCRCSQVGFVRGLQSGLVFDAI